MKRLVASLCLVILIGLTPVYKNFKGKQFCLQLKNDHLDGKIKNKLEKYSGVEGSDVYDYCSKLGVSGMDSEPFPY
tara:strand:+ start:257 stop:484 length:228 start_codon:yes stop_codon:yes gene_type:complete